MSGISFKINAPPRPSSAASSAPPSRPSSAARSRPPHSATPTDDHSDDDEDGEDNGRFGRLQERDRKRPRLGQGDEEVVEFGRNGATAKNAKPTTGPLVIPALPNKDWRKAAEELRAGRNPNRKKRDMYIPETGGSMRMGRGLEDRPSGAGAAAPVTADVDAINTEEVVGGLERPVKKERTGTEDRVEQVREEVAQVEVASPAPAPPAPRVAETEEQRALRELLGGAAGAKEEEAELEAIQMAADDRGGPVSEEQAFKRDLESRPDEASLDDYARVPVGQFGLAMLRGMGWQPGQAASRSGRGAIEAHVPSSRPALLGIGAKPMAEAMGDAAGKDKGKKGGGSRREDMKFVPLMKRERERIEGGSASGSGRSSPLALDSTSSSRRSSRSPPRDRDRDRDRDRRRSRSPRRKYDADDRGSSRRDSDRERDRRDRDRGTSWRDDDRDRDRRGGSSRYDDDRRGSSRYDNDRRDRRREDDDRRERRRDGDRRERDRDGRRY
ncbi:hypothetical protein JCM10207_002130 [Rhodosporidiobolus poonsookiae]